MGRGWPNKCEYFYNCPNAKDFEMCYFSCKQYKPIPDLDMLLELANDCEERMKFEKEHVSNGMAHDYYGNILRDVIDCIRRECEGYVKD